MQFPQIVPPTGALRMGLLNKFSQELVLHQDHLFAPMLNAQDDYGNPLLARDPLLFQLATIGTLQPLLDLWLATYHWWQSVCVQHNKAPLHNWATISLECMGLTPAKTYQLIRVRFAQNRSEMNFLQGHDLIPISVDGEMRAIAAQQYYQKEVFNILTLHSIFPPGVMEVFVDISKLYLERDKQDTGRLLTQTGKLRDHYTEIGMYLADLKKRDTNLYEQVLLWLGNSKSPYFQIDPLNMACSGSDLAANAFPAQLPTTVNFCSAFADYSETES